MKTWLALLGITLTVLVAVIVARTVALKPQIAAAAAPAKIVLDEAAVAEHLGAALRFKTISHTDIDQREFSQWLAFHRFLEQTFPKAHKTLKRELVAQYSLLYTWPGSQPDLKPMAFLAHQDVVPITPGTEDKWSEPPFAGKITGGFIWGRGALDDKAGLMGLMEGMERLAAEGYQPQRTLIFAFGHDEEVGGKEGAKAISALLESRGIQLEAILDEGGFVALGSVPGVKRPVGLVGVAEKGYVSVILTSQAAGGHSSMPPPKTAIGQLTEAVTRLEKNPLPASLRSPTREMLVTLGPEMGFSKRLALANLWIFEPLILKLMEASPPSNASIRSTTAPTIFQAGVKDNVLPVSARAVVNFRLMPGETSQTLLEHVRRTIRNEEIELSTDIHGEPSAVSDTSALPFGHIRTLVQNHFPEVVVTPFLTIAGTDTRHYMRLSRNVYRFLPLPLGSEDVPRIHGINERIGVADYANSVRFYYDAVKSLSE